MLCGLQPRLYILSFLHQTTTEIRLENIYCRCISYLFYIKPQPVSTLFLAIVSCISYLFYIKPQHTLTNIITYRGCISYLFYIKPQPLSIRAYHLSCCISYLFYIKPQRDTEEQTVVVVVYPIFSTSNHNSGQIENILSALYILSFLHQTTTDCQFFKYKRRLYILSFLHQTTTCFCATCSFGSCISYLFYIKPQL